MMFTVAVFLCLLAASVPVFLFLPTTVIDLFGNIGQLAGLLFAGVSFWQAREQTHETNVHKAFARIAFGMCIWALGQLLVTYSEVVLHKSPYGTISSIFFVLGNGLVLLAIFSLLRNSVQAVPPKDVRRYLLQSALLGFFLTVFVLLMIKGSVSNTTRDIFQRILDPLYPFFDIAEMLLSLVLIRIALHSKDYVRAKAYAFFFGAFSILEIGDLITIDAGFETFLYRAVDLLYFSCYFLIAISGIYMARSLSKARSSI